MIVIVPSGIYNAEFMVVNGAGCGFINGGPCDQNHSENDFQSPGPVWDDDDNRALTALAFSRTFVI